MNWIKVEDELPSYDKLVLVYECTHENIRTGLLYRTDGKGHHWYDRNEEYSLDVTHWMPLPKTPEL